MIYASRWILISSGMLLLFGAALGGPLCYLRPGHGHVASAVPSPGLCSHVLLLDALVQPKAANTHTLTRAAQVILASLPRTPTEEGPRVLVSMPAVYSIPSVELLRRWGVHGIDLQMHDLTNTAANADAAFSSVGDIVKKLRASQLTVAITIPLILAETAGEAGHMMDTLRLADIIIIDRLPALFMVPFEHHREKESVVLANTSSTLGKLQERLSTIPGKSGPQIALKMLLYEGFRLQRLHQLYVKSISDIKLRFSNESDTWLDNMQNLLWQKLRSKACRISANDTEVEYFPALTHLLKKLQPSFELAIWSLDLDDKRHICSKEDFKFTKLLINVKHSIDRHSNSNSELQKVDTLYLHSKSLKEMPPRGSSDTPTSYGEQKTERRTHQSAYKTQINTLPASFNAPPPPRQHWYRRNPVPFRPPYWHVGDTLLSPTPVPVYGPPSTRVTPTVIPRVIPGNTASARPENSARLKPSIPIGLRSPNPSGVRPTSMPIVRTMNMQRMTPTNVPPSSDSHRPEEQFIHSKSFANLPAPSFYREGNDVKMRKNRNEYVSPSSSPAAVDSKDIHVKIVLDIPKSKLIGAWEVPSGVHRQRQRRDVDTAKNGECSFTRPIPDPEDTTCRVYLQCTDGKIYRYNCGHTAVFDPQARSCVSPNIISKCNGAQTLWSVEQEDNFKCSAEGYFPHPEKCNMFYRCTQTSVHLFRCPDGLGFDPQTATCDTKNLVPNCQDMSLSNRVSKGKPNSLGEKRIQNWGGGMKIHEQKEPLFSAHEQQESAGGTNPNLSIRSSHDDSVWKKGPYEDSKDGKGVGGMGIYTSPDEDISAREQVDESLSSYIFDRTGIQIWPPLPNQFLHFQRHPDNLPNEIQRINPTPISIPGTPGYIDVASSPFVVDQFYTNNEIQRKIDLNDEELRTLKNNLGDNWLGLARASSISIARNFVCPSDGYFRDPDTCTKFYHCSHGLPYHVQCTGGLVFNPRNRICDWQKSMPECDDHFKTTSFAPKATLVSSIPVVNDTTELGGCYPGTARRHPADCSRFFVCNARGVEYQFRCPGTSLAFDEKSRQCVPRHTVSECNNQMELGILNDPDSSIPAFTCPSPYGFFRDEKNCSRFYECAFRIPFKMSCPPGAFFSERRGACEHEDRVPDCLPGGRLWARAKELADGTISPHRHDAGDEAMKFECSRNGRFADPHDCSLFHECGEDGEHMQYSCPVHMVFNPAVGLCDHYYNVPSCWDRAPPPRAPTAPSPLLRPDLTPPPVSPPEPAPISHTESGMHNVDTAWASQQRSPPSSSIVIPPPSIPATVRPLISPRVPPHMAGTITIKKTGLPCGGESMFHNPSDCRQFFWCFKGELVSNTCPTPLVFNTRTYQCDLPENVPRCALLSPPTSHNQDEYSQREYYSNYQPSKTYVPGMVDAAKSGPQDQRGGSYSNSNRDFKQDERAASADDFECPHDGYFRDPNNCQQFYFCQDSWRYKYACAEGRSFDENKLFCNWSHLVENCP